MCNSTTKIKTQNVVVTSSIILTEEEQEIQLKLELERIKAKKEKQKDYYYKRTYGIDLDTYNKIKDNQNSECKICAKTNCKLVVDHCHTTGLIRGLLCHNCNVALGHLRDKPEVIGRCIEYLQEAREYTVSGIKITMKEFKDQKKYTMQEI